MSNDMEPQHRRRRRPAQPSDQAPPVRIVLSGEDKQPDWMVSQISGAASRRMGQKTSEPDKTKPARSTEETRQILTLKKKEASGKNINATEKKQAERKPTEKKDSSVRRKVEAPKKKAARPTSKKKMSKKARERRQKQIRRTAALVLTAVLAVVLVVVLSISGSRLVEIKKTLDRGEGVFYPNIFVNDIPLEGKTLDEAAAVVTQQVTSLISSFKVTLRTQDGRSWDITGSDLQMRYNVANQLDQLWAIGHTGSSSERYKQVKELEETPVMRYTTLGYDMSRVNQILTQIKSEVDQPAVSAKRVDDNTKWPPFSYTDDIPGQTLDITGLNEKIIAMVDKLESGVVDLTPVPVQATITREQLEGQIVKLSTFETTIGKTGDYVEAREANIRIGTERFNHLIVHPGESVSFNKVTGRRADPKNGYQTALEIAYGEYREGRGGGICQVSSTLYNAVVNAGLRVDKRVPHAIPSSYVDMGLDATVSDDRYDFVFTNTTNADIYIEAEVYKSKNNYWHPRFTIYGRPDPKGYTYKLVSEVTQTLPLPEPEYRQDKEAKYVIYNDETYQSSKGREGYVVDAYLITMDSKGLEVSREKKYTDTYKPSAPIIYQGVSPRETTLPPDFMPID